MRLDFLAPPTTPLRVVPSLVRQVERSGFEGLWFTEGPRTPFTAVASASSATDELLLGSCVALALPRSPMITAQLAWELAEASRGRFILGLGTQLPDHLARRFSVPFDRPGARLREYVLALRAIFRSFGGEALDFKGEFWSLDLLPPFLAPGPIEHPDIPIYVGAVRPWMARMAGEVADGVQVNPLHSVKYIDEVLRPSIRDGALAAGRNEADISLVCPPFTFVGEEEELETLRDQARLWVALFGSGDAVASLFAIHGWEDTHQQLQTMDPYVDVGAMVASISDEMVDLLTVTTTWDRIADVLEERYASRAGHVLINNPMTGSSEQDLDAIGRWQAVAKALNGSDK